MGQCIINRTTQPLYWGDGGTPTVVDEVNELFKRLYPVGSVYHNTNNVNPATIITGTTWQLISSVALASENVFGNGKALGLTDGSVQRAFASDGGSGFVGNNIGTNVGASASGGTGAGSKYYGLPTKAQIPSNPENSGLIADTITLYTWERTA